MRLSLYHDAPAGSTDLHARRFGDERVLERMRALDEQARRDGLGSVDADDPLARIGMEIDGDGSVTKNSYGLFHLSWLAREQGDWAARIEAELEEIRGGFRQAHGTRLRYVIWAGMGGSVEDKSMYQAMGLLRRGPRFYALDSTDPAKLKAILADIEKRSGKKQSEVLRSTLVVGMAMGMTSYEPVVNLEKLAALYDRHGIDSRPNFLYMTLTGSLLDQFAGPRGYRRVELQMDGGNATAGRHSAPLTRGSLYPLGLAGVDLKGWIAGTLLGEEEIAAALRLAAFLHAQGEAGRDKVTLLLPRGWQGASLWTKQNFEESLGKSEQLGIKIVTGETARIADYRAPRDPAQDRLFLAVRVKGAGSATDAAKLQTLRRSGYPLAVLDVPAGAPLARYMQFIHYTVFGIGYLREMNFITQPSVELYKSIANEIHAEAGRAGGVERTGAWSAMTSSPRQARWRGLLTLHWDGIEFDAPPRADAAAIYTAILKKLAAGREAEYGELTFFGDTRYSPNGRMLRKQLDRAAARVFRNGLKMPADVYEGPAMNHSYHEMIIGHGKCVSTVLLSRKQEEIPAAGYTPGYHLAQFLATKLALERRGRAVMALLLNDTGEKSRAALREFFEAAAAALR